MSFTAESPVTGEMGERGNQWPRHLGWGERRVITAKRDTSVSQLIAEMLKKEMRDEDTYEAAMREHFAIVKPMKRRRPGERLRTRGAPTPDPHQRAVREPGGRGPSRHGDR